MKNLPKIVIGENLEREVNVFLNFLNHPDYPQKRNSILKTFPDLKSLLEKSENEKTTVRNFIVNFRKKHKTIVKIILLRNGLLLKKNGQIALQGLANIMDYQWPKPITYIAIPTILPFSPFGDNIFYFSILRQINSKKPNKDILYITIHEISHFIFFDLLKKIEKKNKFKLTKDAMNYLKEALTAALLNQKIFLSLFGLKEDVGNPEIRDLFIETDEKVKTIRNFIQEFYIQRVKKEKKSFEVFLDELINIFISIAPDLSRKRLIWNRYGRTLIEKPKILAQYRKPIPIK